MGKLGGVIALVLLGGGLWVLPFEQRTAPDERARRDDRWGLWPFALEERSTYTYCRQCGTDREAHECRLGSVRLWLWSRTTPSLAFRDLLDANHQHVWELNCVSVKSARGESLG